jgi:hypothetical protein
MTEKVRMAVAQLQGRQMGRVSAWLVGCKSISL